MKYNLNYRIHKVFSDSKIASEFYNSDFFQITHFKMKNIYRTKDSFGMLRSMGVLEKAMEVQ